MKLKSGQSAPNFKLVSTDGNVFELNTINEPLHCLLATNRFSNKA